MYETVLWLRYVALPALGVVVGGMLAAALVDVQTVLAVVAVTVTAALCGLACFLIGQLVEE